jgi:hypothetical protein
MAKFGDDFEFPDEIEAKATKQETVEDDKFEVEIEDDTPLEDRGVKPMKGVVEDPTEEELNNYTKQAERRLRKFSKGYHDERRAKEEALREREAAETFARQVYEENKRLQQQLANGSKALIETSKESAENKLQTAKRKLKEAHEIGDFDAVADAQADIADATMEARQAANMRPVEVDNEKFTAPPQTQQPQAPTISRRTQRWVSENNDWWGVDDEMTATALGLDKKLAKEYGTEYVGTEEYYRTIDKTMRKRFPEHFESDQSHEDDEPPQRKRAEPADEEDSPRRASRPATVVASATRSTPPNRVKLKGSEATIARRLGVPIEEYAKQVALLRKGN